MKDSALPVGIIIGVAIFLLILLVPSPGEARKDEMNKQLTRIADALELIASAVKTQ